MAEISTYASGRLKTNERRIAKILLGLVESSNELSKEFKDRFQVSVSAKYQSLTLIIPKTNDKELGVFEYNILDKWADDNNIGWNWEDERETYNTIGWDLR